MMLMKLDPTKAWRNFSGNAWQRRIDVRDFMLRRIRRAHGR